HGGCGHTARRDPHASSGLRGRLAQLRKCGLPRSIEARARSTIQRFDTLFEQRSRARLELRAIVFKTVLHDVLAFRSHSSEPLADGSSCARKPWTARE